MPAIKSSAIPPMKPPAADNTSRSRKPGGRALPNRAMKSVLSVSPRPDDHAALRLILDGIAWRLSAVANCHEAIEHLHRDPVSVVLCESVLEDGTWKDILNHISRGADPPLLIVTSRVADEYLWAEVLNLGGYDVLAKPFSQQEVRHVLTTISLYQINPVPRTRTAGA